MKTHQKSTARGFSLIELLASITIIVLLAGLIVGGLGYAQDKQAREKAKVQIALLSKGLEDFNLDNGSYPVGTGSGTGRSNMLYQRLYFDGARTNPPGRIYVAELDPNNTSQGWIAGSGTAARINDPWGHEYRYRSGRLANGNINPSAINPDFDLWSIGKDGRHNAGTNASPFDPNHADNRDDIRNF
jgi:prepilin-type N-terminal cleavage/methylation domain-containing protein